MSSKIEVAEHPNYRTINVNGVIASHGPASIQLILFSEDLECKEMLSDPLLSSANIRQKRILECRLLMDPYSAKVIQNAINAHVDDYEKKFGKITPPAQPKQDGSEDKQNRPNVYT
jgi:hypothetical protein